ncbi:HtaA domain-containing protein [Amycolatopsis sp. GM8]|uniref:HtaA domain-containing protein n=1 Tax=Amycolatopsis sp. GM8 TaxID=2896530 RepID=UPI001F4314AD|nr:HtaA domain-containing protein [Amycolatopsis sp. GM8]
MTQESATQAEDMPIPPYGLRWGVKTSFVGYVARMPDGQAYLGEGAAVNERNELIFPLSEETPAEADAEQAFAFGGDVRFSGHFGMLFVRIAEPRIAVRGGEAELTVVDPESEEDKRLRLVTFTLTGPETEDGTERWEGADVRLTAEGVELFGDVYQAGEPFEPLTVTVPVREGR